MTLFKSDGKYIFKNYYSISSHSQATRTDGINIIIPKIKTEVAKKGCFYAGAKAFNDLLPELKSVKSFLIFKSKIGEFF